jgi:hypothetical protein
MEQEEIKKKVKKQNRQPGIEKIMEPRPEVIKPNYKAASKLEGKTALINNYSHGILRYK